MNYNLSILKLKKDVFILVRDNDGITPLSAYFGQNGVRSKGKTLIVDLHLLCSLESYKLADFFIAKNINNFNRVFIIGLEKEWSNININKSKPTFLTSLKYVSKKILFFNISKWLRDNNITVEQIHWIEEVFYRLNADKRFLSGQIKERKRINELKKIIKSIDDKAEVRKRELNNMKESQSPRETNIKNIKNMKWIEKIDCIQNSCLRILTKPMACTYVPNIGKYVPYRYIKNSDILYRIMKYQCLGKYFIILPDYYILNEYFDIRADSNTTYPFSKVRNVMIKNTYFHGMAPHIGNGSACHGELSGAIGSAQKNGLDIFLMSFEAYLRSINLPDAAGQRFYVLPMGDEDGNIEVWPYLENAMKDAKVKFPKGEKRTLETYEKILNTKEMSKLGEMYGKSWDGNATLMRDDAMEENFNSCLSLIKEREPKIYEQIMERVERGVVL